MKRVSASKKLAIISVSLAMGIAAGILSYCHFQKELTEWQKNQDISFERNTGSTKFNAIVKSVSVGFAGFGVTACGIIFCLRIKTLKSKK